MSRRKLIVEADGGSRGNPGPAGYGALVLDAETGAVLAEAAGSLGIATNNVAEYSGLIAGLEAAAAIDPRAQVEVRMDSKLVVEQMSGRWGIKHADMRRLATRARAVLPADNVRYTWVPRAANARADRLANRAMDGEAAPGGDRPSPAAPTPQPAARPATPPGPAPDAGEPVTLILARHGHTPLTERRLLSGSGGSDPGLSPVGEADARALAAALAADSTGLGRPSAIVASPLQRTRQTAQACAAALGLPVTVDDGWAEASFGEWEGLSYAELVRRWPEEFAAWRGSLTVAPPGGESLAALTARVGQARERAVKGHPGQVVLVVTHLTPVRAVVAEALDAGTAALWRLRADPCSRTAVRYWPDGAVELAAANLPAANVPAARLP